MRLRWFKILLILFCLAALGFIPGKNRATYVIVFDTQKINPAQVFASVEQYVMTQGFSLKRKLEESRPEKIVVSNLESAMPQKKGDVLIFLTLLFKNNIEIEMEWAHYRSGCIPAQEIEADRKLKSGLSQYLENKYGIPFEIRKRRDASIRPDLTG